jgi:hypothetical protein
MQMTALFGLLELIYNNWFVRIVLMMIGLNILTGIAAALYQGKFALGALGTWLLSRALPYVLVAGGLQVAMAMMVGYEAVLGDYSTAFKALSAGVWIVVCATMVGHIGQNLRDMGLGVPDVLTMRKPTLVPIEATAAAWTPDWPASWPVPPGWTLPAPPPPASDEWTRAGRTPSTQ